MRLANMVSIEKIERLFVVRSIAQIYRQAYEIEYEKLRTRGRGSRQPKAHRTVLRMIKILRAKAFPSALREATVPPVMLATPTDEASRHEASTAPPSTQLPEWMIGEFKFFAEKERALFPSAEFLHRFETWLPPEDPMPGNAYARAITSLERPNYEAIILAPGLKYGGADKGVLQFCKAYAEKTHVLLITTMDEPSPCLPMAPSTVEVLELGPLIRDLSSYDAQVVLGRLLMQLSPKLIHIVQSRLGWETVLDHALSLRALDCKLISSLFCEETGPEERPYGFAIDHAPQAVRLFDAILTDNEPYRMRLASCFQGHDRLFKTIHFAHDHDCAPSPQTAEKKAGHVLWAGRLCAQKRIDLLHAIALQRPDLSFDVFGVAETDPYTTSWTEMLAALPNVSLRGPYQGFENIPEKDSYACFLYTTAYDGLPNVLVEAASERIPMIAPPSIGGLSDLVRPETAWCVEAPDDPSSYIKALDACLNDDPSGRCENSLALVRERHSWDHFRDTVHRTLHEIGVKLGEPPTSCRQRA